MAKRVGTRKVSTPKLAGPSRIVFSERRPGTTAPKGGELIISVFSRPSAVKFAKNFLNNRAGFMAIQKSRRHFGSGSMWSLYHVGARPQDKI
jgi:hypothetical protein